MRDWNEDNLIPCPKCGGKLHLKDTFDSEAYHVVCENCDYRKGPYEYPQ